MNSSHFLYRYQNPQIFINRSNDTVKILIENDFFDGIIEENNRLKIITKITKYIWSVNIIFFIASGITERNNGLRIGIGIGVISSIANVYFTSRLLYTQPKAWKIRRHFEKLNAKPRVTELHDHVTNLCSKGIVKKSFPDESKQLLQVLFQDNIQEFSIDPKNKNQITVTLYREIKKHTTSTLNWSPAYKFHSLSDYCDCYTFSKPKEKPRENVELLLPKKIVILFQNNKILFPVEKFAPSQQDIHTKDRFIWSCCQTGNNSTLQIHVTVGVWSAFDTFMDYKYKQSFEFKKFIESITSDE